MDALCILLAWFLFVSLIGIITLPRDTIENKKVINVLEWTVVIVLFALIIVKTIKNENPPKAKETIEETNSQEAQSKSFKNSYLFCYYKRK